MARSRNIKPGFFTNEGLVELPYSTRLLFIGLWTIADRAGRLEDRPKRIKMALFPADDVNIDVALNELQQTGFLLRYEHDGARYIQVLAFDKHQHPHRDEPQSIIPAPCLHHTSTMQTPCSSDQSAEQNPIPASCEHHTSTVQASCEHDANTMRARLVSDSLNLVSDSLNTDSLNPGDSEKLSSSHTLSGKKRPTAGWPVDKSNGTDNDKHHGDFEQPNAIARRVLEFLNQKTGHSFQPVETNLRLIRGRLREGITETNLRQIIAMKSREWLNDDKTKQWLRPATLFDSTKCHQYVGELFRPEDS